MTIYHGDNEMNESLFHIAHEYAAALEELASSDLPLEAIEDTLEGMALGVTEKVTNTAKYIKNLEVTSAAIKEQEKIMAERRKRLEKKIGRLREYLMVNMEHAGIKKANSALINVALKKNPPSVTVVDQAVVPRYLIKQKVSESVDKAAAKQLLKDGNDVPGIELVQSTRLDIK
jgi:hypothetical protein